MDATEVAAAAAAVISAAGEAEVASGHRLSPPSVLLVSSQQGYVTLNRPIGVNFDTN